MIRWALALWLLLLAGPAFAGHIEEAERAFSAGDQAYKAGQYLAAARAYENAYALHPLPEITFSMAQAYRRHYFEDPNVQWLETAQKLYRRYLDEQPQGSRRAHAVTHLGSIAVLLAQRANEERPPEAARAPTELLVSSTTAGAKASIDGEPPQDVPLVRQVTPGKHRVEVHADGFVSAERKVQALEGRMVIAPIDLEALPGALRVDAEAGAEVWIDGDRATHTPMAAPRTLPAGRHVIAVTAPGRRPASRVVDVPRAGLATLRIDLETSDQRIAAHWLLAGAGGFALLGGVLAVVAVVSEAQAEDARAVTGEGRPMDPAEAQASNDALARRDLTRGLSIASFGLGAIAGATGGLLFLFDSPLPSTPGDSARFGLTLTGAF